MDRIFPKSLEKRWKDPTKRSIPKWILPNPGLVEPSVKKEGLKGFVFENLIGSHILNIIFGLKEYELQYWREEGKELDFIITHHNQPVVAFEVKSGRQRNIPEHDTLIQKGIDCPLKVISLKNAETFLQTTAMEALEQFKTDTK